MSNSERWGKELNERMRLAEATHSPIINNPDEFDVIFGKGVEKTLTEYRLMLTELVSVRRALRIFIRVFWMLSALLVVSIGAIGYFAYEADQSAKKNGAKLTTLIESHP